MTITKTLKFKEVGGPFGDATSNYVIENAPGMTIDDFVNAVLAIKDEWGSIEIYYPKETDYRKKRKPVLEYDHGKIKEWKVAADEYDIMKCLKIKSVSANGGWSLMSYNIQLDLETNTERVVKDCTKDDRIYFMDM